MLLPAFPGLEAQQQAFAYGVKVIRMHGSLCRRRTRPRRHHPAESRSGASTHDDEHTLAARILEQEHIAYSEAIRIVLEGNYEIVGRRLVGKLARGSWLMGSQLRHPTNFSISFSSITVTPNSFALSSFEPASLPATT